MKGDHLLTTPTLRLRTSGAKRSSTYSQVANEAIVVLGTARNSGVPKENYDQCEC